MVMLSAQLVDGARVMILYPRTDLVLMSVTPGSPTVRVVTENRADTDGEVDTTTRHGGRAVAVELRAIERPGAVLDELGRFINPASRPYLLIDDDDWTTSPRRIQLRFDQLESAQLAEDAPNIRDIQVQWRAPAGVWEGEGEIPETVPADVPSSTGRSYPKTYAWAYATTLATGSLEIVNPGNQESHFVARLYGPCSGPRLINDLTGEELAFGSSLILGAGEYVEVSTLNRTAYLLSISTNDRLSYLDYGVSEWWRIQPGAQQLRYVPASASAGSQAEITYRPNWI